MGQKMVTPVASHPYRGAGKVRAHLSEPLPSEMLRQQALECSSYNAFVDDFTVFLILSRLAEEGDIASVHNVLLVCKQTWHIGMDDRLWERIAVALALPPLKNVDADLSWYHRVFLGTARMRAYFDIEIDDRPLGRITMEVR
jgi:hypothetical protein